jgi:nucleoside-diphosphate-sugar epimerase
MANVYVTGVSGFVGSTLVRTLERRGHVIYPISFRESLSSQRFAMVEPCETLIHTAARVHVMKDVAVDPLSDFRIANSTGTVELARKAALAGVKRFIFISSIKVNGEATQLGHPFAADDVPAPPDAYGVSKMEAENGLCDIAGETGMEVVIIRPTLVYGPGVKANFAAMMRWLQRGVPLPLGAIRNQRSLVALDNLVDLIVTCLTHPAAANQTFLVSDGEDVSTTELLRRMGQALGCPARLIPVPASWLKLAATMVGKQDVAQRLCGSLQVDIEKTRRLLGWAPPLSLSEGLRRAAGSAGAFTN